MNKSLLFLSILFSLSISHSAEVDATQSEFKWTGKKVTGQHYGKVPLKSSQLVEKDGKIIGGEIILDIAQLTVEDLTGEYKEKFLTHMKSADFFDIAQWPTAKLKITAVNGNKAEGQLTVKDKTNKVSFGFAKKGVFYTGTLIFDRTQYGMIYGSSNFVKNLGDKMIYNDVTLDFKVAVKH